MPSDQSNQPTGSASGAASGPASAAAASRVTALSLAWDPATADAPAHQRLATLLRTQVTDGRLRPGDRLPPTRVLADELALSRWVVTEAYDQLKAEGWLEGRVGSGTVVAAAPGARAQAPATASAATGALRERALDGDLLDLSPALPDLASFPRTAWRAALGRAIATVGDAELGHPDPAGAPRLRETLADYLRRVRGLDVDAGRVHVTQGVRSAVSLVCLTLRESGARRLAVEDPCWPTVREVARRHGLEVVPVPVDGDGMRVADLVRYDARHRVDAVLVTPTHQFPTGVTLSASRRIALLRWAADGGRLVVEDDYDAEFRYDRRPVGALAALAPDRVVYLGSTSKTLSPGLHLGWMIAPHAISPALAATRAAVAGAVPTLDQLALVELISGGAFDRHLRRMRKVYQGRRRALVDALRRNLPGRVAPSMDAGLHVLWLLPDGVVEDTVVAACAERGVAVLGLSRCRVGRGTPGLVLGYGNVPEDRADAVARTLAAAVDG